MKLGRLVRKVSIFDKRDKSNYRRHEKVTDAQTGEIIYFQDHDLRDHVGRGSDKKTYSKDSDRDDGTNPPSA